MGAIKYTFLYTLCFYYAFLTPKAADFKTNLENYLFEVIFVAIGQGLLMWGIIEFFDAEWALRGLVMDLTGYRPALWEFCVFAGAWTLLGGLQYPYLVETSKEDKEKKDYESAHQQAWKEAEQEVEAEYRQAGLVVWNKILNEKTPEYCLDYLNRSKELIDDGLEPSAYWGHEDHFDLLKDPKWRSAEMNRLKQVIKRG